MIKRQGDVLIMSTKYCDENGIPYKKEKGEMQHPIRGRTILAEGEATGHAHAVPATDASIWEIPGSMDLLLDVKRPTTVSHEEHGALALDKGTHIIRRQEEYIWGSRIVVAD
ncbi:MAG: hypothetical protein ACYTBJ_01260 [Planctomycetota bacterium]|jgi:hypothetical protein